MNNALKEIVNEIVADDALHAKWLNSLSLMENCGARKIAAYQHPVDTDIVVLKHAAEEFRHAFFLKKLIGKLDGQSCSDYSDEHLVAPTHTRQYLNRLDVAVCRMLMKELGYSFEKAKEGAYLLVTYAIEVRADELYGTYQDALTAHGSKVNVKSIIAEEEGHLQEMTEMLQTYDLTWQQLAERAVVLESEFYNTWIDSVWSWVKSSKLVAVH
jgi:rubrerythrin